ncbi:Os08g0507301 [Oryza sativa Japonica Group]|uniref:Os08g0507301 protein n=1 Tax=Oryza sativa subsp. japonica TaxID=39947 RepID=C7J657_ORYSJ|nr:Os08g0507301 [Oryza sativa Japonica Group]|eukprot:NP_001175651.1 Os08g0507301 [Oryza sativa Japonica Group]
MAVGRRDPSPSPPPKRRWGGDGGEIHPLSSPDAAARTATTPRRPPSPLLKQRRWRRLEGGSTSSPATAQNGGCRRVELLGGGRCCLLRQDPFPFTSSSSHLLYSSLSLPCVVYMTQKCGPKPEAPQRSDVEENLRPGLPRLNGPSLHCESPESWMDLAHERQHIGSGVGHSCKSVKMMESL